MRGAAGGTLLIIGVVIALAPWGAMTGTAAVAPDGATLFVAKGCVASHDAPGRARAARSGQTSARSERTEKRYAAASASPGRSWSSGSRT